MFGPLRERLEKAVEKVEGMLVGYAFSLFDLVYCSFIKSFLRFVHVDEKGLMVGFAGVWFADG